MQLSVKHGPCRGLSRITGEQADALGDLALATFRSTIAKSGRAVAGVLSKPDSMINVRWLQLPKARQ